MHNFLTSIYVKDWLNSCHIHETTNCWLIFLRGSCVENRVSHPKFRKFYISKKSFSDPIAAAFHAIRSKKALEIKNFYFGQLLLNDFEDSDMPQSEKEKIDEKLTKKYKDSQWLYNSEEAQVEARKILTKFLKNRR